MPQKATTARPTVARALQAAGYEIKAIPSVWNPGKLEWEFALDSISAEIVRSCYARIGKPCPRAVQRFLDDQEEGGVADE